MPKVSFILPAYKRRFLHEAIASILAQTYRDFELVVVDDCSPEDLKSVVDEFHDERLTYCRNDENLGGKDLVSAWNRALGYAKGEWVVCAGDDDAYMSNFAEEMIRLSERYPHVDVFHCRFAIIDARGEIIKLSRPRAEFENQAEMIFNSTVVRTEQKLPDFMYRRSALVARGGYVWSPTGWYSDVMTAIALSETGGAGFKNDILLKWRSSGDNISSRSDDIKSKIEAGMLFKEWIWPIVNSLKSGTENDRILLGEIKKGVNLDIYNIMKSYWWKAPYDVAMKVLRESTIEENVKREWIRSRRYAERGVVARLRKLRNYLIGK